jgi:hypothetical protein
LTSIIIYLMIFTHTALHKKRGSQFTSLIFTYLIFFTHAELTNPDWRIIILFIHINQRHMKSKRHLYIYIHKIFSKIKSKFLLTNKCLLHHTEGELQSPETIIIIGLDKAGKIVQGDSCRRHCMRCWLTLLAPHHRLWSPCYITDILYRWGVNDIMIKCISREECIQSIRDIEFLSIIQQKLNVWLLLHKRAWTSLKPPCSSLRLILHHHIFSDPYHKYLMMRCRHWVIYPYISVVDLGRFFID